MAEIKIAEPQETEFGSEFQKISEYKSREEFGLTQEPKAQEEISTGGTMGKQEVDKIVAEAVTQERQQHHKTEGQPLTAREIADILHNVELKVGKTVEGMDPKTLLETILNLPRSNN